MALIDLMVDTGSEITQTPAFRQMVEDHLQWIIRHPTTQWVEIDAHAAHKYKGDFYGLMTHMKTPYHLHWLIMRVNGYNSPMQYNGDHIRLRIPDTHVIDRLLKAHRVNQTI